MNQIEVIPITNPDFLYEDDRGKKITQSKLIDFLEENGFNSIILDGRRELIREVNGIVDIITPKTIFDFLRATLDTPYLREYYDVFAENPGKYIGGPKLQLLKNIDLVNDRDPRNSSRFYFQNCFCEVDEKSITLRDYSELNGSIWQKRIIKNDYSNSTTKSTGQFYQWCINITGKSPTRLLALRSILGYLLHRNKERGENKAIILYDERMGDENKANGRVGKTMLGEAIRQCREVVMNDCKTKDLRSQFANELVSITTDCVYYDDLPKNTKFENFYSFITTGVEVNKKFKPAFRIEGDRSPKLVISSNYYVLGDGGDSDQARRFEFEISNYYNAEFQPENDFGNRFWDSKWPKEEWNKFYEFMMGCVQVYLEHGLLNVEPINLKSKKIEDSTCPEFLEFAKAYFEIDKEMDKRELEAAFKKIYPQWETVSAHRFFKWCNSYAHDNDFTFEAEPSGGKYPCIFRSKSIRHE